MTEVLAGRELHKSFGLPLLELITRHDAVRYE